MAVVGAGAIGLLYASKAIQAGHEVTLYVKRDDQKKALICNGLMVNNQKVHGAIVQLMDDYQPHFDVVVITTKQTHVGEIIDVIKKKDHTSPLLFLQNGMGHTKDFNELHNPVAVGVVEHGAIREHDTSVRHTGVGRTRLASVSIESGILEGWIRQWELEQFSFELEDNWYRMLARKLVINATVNPLTALFQVKNGDLTRNPYLSQLARSLCKEACLSLGLPNESDHWKSVIEVIDDTKENESSMLQDIKNGKRSEIDAISGYIISRTDIELPNTSFVYHAILAIHHQQRGE